MARRFVGVGVLVGLFAGCATPVPPSGGPADRTPPAIVASEPASGSVNVERRTVRIEFSEWVDQRSFESSLIVTPEPEGRLSFRWRRRTVEIEFPERLRANTTYVLTIGSDFRDFSGTRLASPITLAFSTGPVINQGRIGGLVVDAELGRPVEGIDIYAYPGPSTEASPPDSLPAQPGYRTQSGADGRFQFEYLSESPFYVVALRDANRNRRPDPGEAFAVPPRPWIVADSVGASPERPWVTAVVDTLPPSLTRARALSNRRIDVRFTEAVVLPDRRPDDWVLTDSLSGVRRSIDRTYTRSADTRSVYLLSEDALPAQPHILVTGAVADSSGNLARALRTSFTPSATADTTSTRFIGFVPDTTAATEGIIELVFDQMPGLRFSHPPTEAELAAYVSVADTGGVRRIASFQTADGTTFVPVLDPPLQPGERISIRVEAEDAAFEQAYRRLAISETGEISGVVALPEAEDAIAVVEVYEEGEDVPLHRVETAPDGTFVASGLPQGDYRLRAFLDEDASGSWSAGRLTPYAPAEPLVWWNESVTVRPRWETALPDTLSFARPPSNAAPAGTP